MAELWRNNAGTTLASGINSSVVSLTVASGSGALFPSPTGDDYFWLTLVEGSVIEIVKCTARSGDVFTVVRQQQGTGPTSFTTGAVVENRLTRESLERLVQSQSAFPLTVVTGDLLAASAPNTVGVVAAVPAGRILRAAGVGTLPAYSTFTVPDTFLAGSIPHASSANTLTALGLGSARRVLQVNAAGTLPEWTDTISLTTVSAVSVELSATSRIVLNGTTLQTQFYTGGAWEVRMNLGTMDTWGSSTGATHNIYAANFASAGPGGEARVYATTGGNSGDARNGIVQDLADGFPFFGWRRDAGSGNPLRIQFAGVDKGAILANGVVFGATSKHASAILDLVSVSQGLGPPNMTTAQRTAISSPRAGLIVYDTNLDALCVYKSGGWHTFTTAAV